MEIEERADGRNVCKGLVPIPISGDIEPGSISLFRLCY